MSRPTSIIIFSLTTVAANKQTPENCAILGYYGVSSGNSLSTFRDNLSVLPQGSKRGKARDIHWFGGWVGPTACPGTNLMRLIYAHIFVPFATLKQAPWTRAISNSRCRALRRHGASDFFSLFFTNCVCVAGHNGILFCLQHSSLCPYWITPPPTLFNKEIQSAYPSQNSMNEINSSSRDAQTKMHSQLRKGNMDRRYHMADLAVYGRFILKWVANIVWRRGMDCIVCGLSLGTGPL